MAHGHHIDTGLCWEWDSVLLLSNPCPLPAPSPEADRSSTGGPREHLGSTPVSSVDHGHFHRGSLRGKETSSTNHGYTDSRSSESQRKDSKGGDKRRDPRLDCPNFLAGRVPCACTDNDDDDSGVSRKRSKPVPRCQVAACGAELTDLKGYHQRHRVCLRCAHATRVILRDQPHRYCQQCGKFHPICDFDEGKRSCRRKLEKHNNRRRRKAGEDSLPASEYGDTDTLNEGSPRDGTKGDVLSEGEVKDCVAKPSFDAEDTCLTPAILPGISSEKSSIVNVKVSETSGFSQMSTAIPSQTLEPSVTTVGKEKVSTAEHAMQDTEASQHVELQFAQEQPSSFAEQVPVTGESHEQSIHVMRPNGFLLHGSSHTDPGVQIRRGNDEESLLALLMDENGATECSQFSESNGEHLVLNSTQLWESSTSPMELKEVAYSSPLPTGRISFKLYDWNPGDFPRQLRQQVMEWLSNMPVDLEGYIRSGCTILTIFIAMPQSVWEDLNADWARSVLKLVKTERSLTRFWSSGYLIARMDDHEVHISNGDLARPFSKKNCDSPVLDRARPLCLEAGSDEEVVVFGRNFHQPQSRLLVSFEGKYVVNDAFQSRLQGKTKGAVTRVHDANHGEEEMLLVSMPALRSTISGTAYIEVEHISGTSNYIPLLIAEKDIADEVRSLEKEMDKPTSCCNPNLYRSRGISHLSQRKVHSLLMDLGWILKNAYLKTFESDLRAEILELHVVRLRRLLFFAVKRRWYNITERVLQLSYRAGLLEGTGVLENGLSALQVAVLCHNEFMVEHVMRCCESLCGSSSECKFWWNLGFAGPNGLTALHIVALQAGTRGLWVTLLKRKDCALMWKHVPDHLGRTPVEYSTRKKISEGIEIRHLTIEHTSEDEQPCVTSSDVPDFPYKDNYEPIWKGETRISLPSLLYRPWKVTRKGNGGVMHRRLSGSFRTSGHQGFSMYISSGRKRSHELLSYVILLLYVGLGVMVQSPNQVTMISLPLQRCRFPAQNGSQ
ncbi:unnamed protein product [Calypogeia fissa]